MVKLQFQSSQFNEQQKNIINEVWNQLVEDGYEAKFLTKDFSEGYASSIFYEFDGVHYEFHVRENNITMNVNKWINDEYIKMEIIILLSEINKMKIGKELIDLINNKMLTRDMEEFEKIEDK